MADEAVGKAEPVRRIGDDVPGAGPRLLQEIDPGGAIPAVGDVGRHHIVAGGNELAGDGAVAAGRLPDGAVEPLYG